MKRLKAIIIQLLKGLSLAVTRFPFTVLSLIITASLLCYTISLSVTPTLIIQKWIFTLMVGALLGMITPFALERFDKLSKAFPAFYGVTILLTAGYFAILWPSPELSSEIAIRTFVAIFAMICAVLWVPAFQGKADFNTIALVHFKSFFTSILYSGVMTAGIAAIIFAIDSLLFSVNYDSYSYMMVMVWVIFAPVFYLSLLPRFNPKTDTEEKKAQYASSYPKILEILVSYIAIPLFAAYTLVLLAYFMKILVTTNWPSGQLGPMVLIYSAVGLVLFILASLPENKFCALYRMIFPKVWIVIVIMQLISVWIRLDAFGVTESRYYVALFGVFSIVAGILLSFRPVSKNRLIALLAAAFAIVSIIPPIDAFTVSRNSQIHRIETYLQAEGILNDGKLSTNANASEKTKVEVTNILTYLDSHSSLKYISWLPEDFRYYEDMKETFGFEPTYSSWPGEKTEYFNASLDSQIPLIISDYDVSIVINSYSYGGANEQTEFPFQLNGAEYTLISTRLSDLDARISVQNASGQELIGTNLYDFAKELRDSLSPGKEMVPPENMTFVVSDKGLDLKIIFQNVSITKSSSQDNDASYTAYVLFKVPEVMK